jgi:hypothetical protein
MLFNTWKNLIWARAIENIAYVITCQHMPGVDDGIATIAGPEEILAESKKEGFIMAKLDLERLNWLREQDHPPAPNYLIRTIPAKSIGLRFHNKKHPSRRPELYTPIVMSERELQDLNP